jgi:hypothetical protein
MFFDKKYTAKLEAAATGGEAAEGAGGEGGLAGGLGDLGGGDAGGAGDLGGLGDLGGDTGGDTGGAAAGADAGGAGGTPAGETGGDKGGETDLLAEPAAKRDDKEYKRGPYKRHQSSYDKGRRIKNYTSLTRPEVGTERSTFAGKTGFGGMDSIARGMIETKEQTDASDEKKLFTTSAEMQTLLEGLFKKDKKHETQ